MDERMSHIIAHVLSGESNANELLALSDWLHANEENRTLFARMQAYWDADSQFGTPYKLILYFNGDFSNLDVAHSRVSTLLKQQFVKIQTNAMTDRTSEYTIYVNSQDCGDSYEVYNALRAALGSSFEVKKRSLVQRLLIVELY